MKLPTAATTSRDSDDDKVQEVDEPILSAPVPNRDSDEVHEVDEPVRQLPPEGVTNGGSDPIDADMYTCKQPPAPYWIQGLELCQQDKAQLREEAWLTDKHVNSCNKLLKQQCPNQNGFQGMLVLAKKLMHMAL